jgi:hypothetical protein
MKWKMSRDHHSFKLLAEGLSALFRYSNVVALQPSRSRAIEKWLSARLREAYDSTTTWLTEAQWSMGRHKPSVIIRTLVHIPIGASTSVPHTF